MIFGPTAMHRWKVLYFEAQNRLFYHLKYNNVYNYSYDVNYISYEAFSWTHWYDLLYC